jgi:hypothetical protein
MSLKSRLDQLQRKAAKKSQRGGTRDFAAEEAKRWEMTDRLFELTPEDRGLVDAAPKLTENEKNAIPVGRSPECSKVGSICIKAHRLQQLQSLATTRKTLIQECPHREQQLNQGGVGHHWLELWKPGSPT